MTKIKIKYRYLVCFIIGLLTFFKLDKMLDLSTFAREACCEGGIVGCNDDEHRGKKSCSKTCYKNGVPIKTICELDSCS